MAKTKTTKNMPRGSAAHNAARGAKVDTSSDYNSSASSSAIQQRPNDELTPMDTGANLLSNAEYLPLASSDKNRMVHDLTSNSIISMGGSIGNGNMPMHHDDNHIKPNEYKYR
jgi:hypothetical protein